MKIIMEVWTIQNRKGRYWSCGLRDWTDLLTFVSTWPTESGVKAATEFYTLNSQTFRQWKNKPKKLTICDMDS